jgi:hypothetical protein
MSDKFILWRFNSKSKDFITEDYLQLPLEVWFMQLMNLDYRGLPHFD